MLIPYKLDKKTEFPCVNSAGMIHECIQYKVTCVSFRYKDIEVTLY